MFDEAAPPNKVPAAEELLVLAPNKVPADVLLVLGAPNKVPACDVVFAIFILTFSLKGRVCFFKKKKVYTCRTKSK